MPFSAYAGCATLCVVACGGLAAPVNAASSVDVAALARAYQASLSAGASPNMGEAKLYVFVSLAMPEASLKALIDQAARTRAVLVLRGLRASSLKQTLAEVQRLMGDRHVQWQIDPQSFDRYGIEHVPAFVLLRAGATPLPCAIGQCIAVNDFAAVAGDVSLDYALRAIERRAVALTPEARSFLQRLQP